MICSIVCCSIGRHLSSIYEAAGLPVQEKDSNHVQIIKSYPNSDYEGRNFRLARNFRAKTTSSSPLVELVQVAHGLGP